MILFDLSRFKSLINIYISKKLKIKMKKTKKRLITFINDSERLFLEDVKDASSI